MSHFGPGGQAQNQYAGVDMYNQHMDQARDTELINLAHEAHVTRVKSRPFDWFICSVFAYLCFCYTGVCAMYYAVRANHAVDWERDPELVRDHTKKAKCLTLTSITIGTVCTVVCIIVVIVMVVQMENAVRSVYGPNFN